ncbi:MAG: hypothetical protein J5J00_05555 [Deltaproteobacteria bacterium]|nr:hypothetical protein [Deltaproteobacteria bacterium]
MRYILWLSFTVAIAAYLCQPIVDPDLFWHIVSGRWILANAALPVSDHWNMFGYGQPWRAYSWLSEIPFALLERIGGFTALFLFKFVVIFALTASLFYICGWFAGNFYVGALFGLIGTAACFNHMTLRPQLLVWILFAWLVLQSEIIAKRGARPATLLPIAGTMCLWANLHITTILGVALVFCWIASKGEMRIAFAAAFSAFVGTLLTPYLGGEWITFISKTSHPFQHASIAEFQPASILQYSTAFPIIILAMLFIFFHLRPRTIEPAKYLYLGAIMFAAFAIVKFMPFACIFGVILLSAFWGREQGHTRTLGNLAEGIARLQALVSAIPVQGLTFLLICWTIVSLYQKLQAPLNKEVVPAAAFDFFIEKKLPLPVLLPFGNGGYAMYRFSDERGELPSERHRVPIDGRTNVTPPEIDEKFQKAFFGKSGWREFFEAVNPESVVWKNESPLVAILLNGTEWCRVFTSGSEREGFSIFLKRAAAMDHHTGNPSCLE